MTTELTMCLCNYARPEQIHQIITELKQQSCQPNIFVWNNNIDVEFKDDRADWVINSNRNSHTRHVIMFWQMASTRLVGRMDDDLHFADDGVLADVIPVLNNLRHRNQMVGAFGVRMYEGETYQDGHHINTAKGQGQLCELKKPLKTRQDLEVDVLKGRILLAKQEASHGLTTGFGHHHTDLYLSTTLAGRHRYFHTVTGQFWNCCDPQDADNCKPRLIDFPEDDKGYCNREGHYEGRDELCQAWVIGALPSRKVRAKVGKRDTEG